MTIKINFKGFCFIAAASFLAAGCSNQTDNREARLTVIGSMERILQDQPLFGSDHAYIESAGNEVESFQVVVGAIGKNLRVTSASMSDLNGEKGRIGSDNVTLFREEYARVRRSSPRAQLPPGLYPDPLVPFINPQTGKQIEPFNEYREKWGEPFIKSGYEMYGLPFDVWKGQNQPLWVDIYVPEGTPGGDYNGTLTVTFENAPDQYGPGNDSITPGDLSVPVTVRVWDFALPAGPSHRNHFGHVAWLIPRVFGADANSQRAHDIELNYCRMMAGHRINPPIPSDYLPEVNPDGTLRIMPERHEKLRNFINDLHVTDFQIPNAPFRDVTGSGRKKAMNYYRDFYK